MPSVEFSIGDLGMAPLGAPKPPIPSLTESSHTVTSQFTSVTDLWTVGDSMSAAARPKR
jgi:hypothetical protein